MNTKRIILNLILITLFLSLVYINTGIAEAWYTYNVLVPIPSSTLTGNGIQNKLNEQGDNVWAGTGSANIYYISAYGKLWGQCSPDMSNCTSNRWKVKNKAFDYEYWNSSTDWGNYMANHSNHGIGVSQFSFQFQPWSGRGYGYTSENGSWGWGAGANATCFYYGPSATANKFTGLPCP